MAAYMTLHTSCGALFHFAVLVMEMTS